MPPVHHRRLLLGGLMSLPAWPVARAQGAPVKLLHVMSYKPDWQWNKDQLAGFLEGLALPQTELKVVALDAKHADPAVMQRAARQALDLVASWQPDLIYTNDDAAQSAFAVPLGASAIPMVYSGVNKEHADYGFDRRPQVTGVLEREHFAGTVNLLKAMKPGKDRLRLALVFDDDPTWVGVAARIRQELARRNDLEVIAWLQPRSFDEYKSRVVALQAQADALGTLGIFRFAKAGGRMADYEEVLRWTVEHSRLPDFSFWDTRVERGTLCAVTVDGTEQGRMAGRMARRILVDKVSPAAIPPEPTTKGRPMISLARARQLGLAVPANLLLSSKVLTRFAWDA